MANLLHENAREFLFPGNNVGILLIHGFTGSPSEMRYLGEYLREKGFTVKGIRLKGHGTTLQDMRSTNYKDWIKSAEEGYKELAESCEEIFVVGFSMGGALALHMAQKFNIKGIVSLSTPIRIHGRQYFVRLMVKYFKVFNEKQINLVQKKDPYIISYDKAPMNCIFSFMKLVSLVKSDIHKVDKPILIMQSYGDGTVHPSSANFIYKRIASTDKSIIFLHKSGHIITCDCEKDQVFEEVHSFISKRSDLYKTSQQDNYSKTMEV